MTTNDSRYFVKIFEKFTIKLSKENKLPTTIRYQKLTKQLIARNNK